MCPKLTQAWTSALFLPGNPSGPLCVFENATLESVDAWSRWVLPLLLTGDWLPHRVSPLAFSILTQPGDGSLVSVDSLVFLEHCSYPELGLIGPEAPSVSQTRPSPNSEAPSMTGEETGEYMILEGRC